MNLKHIFITGVGIGMLAASSAFAWGDDNRSYGGAGGSAIQGQAQGQAQGQQQRANARSTATNAGNSVSISGDYDEAAYAPNVVVGDCQWGVSAGVPGAVAGIGIPGKHCRVLIEAELIEYYWGRQAAGQHLYDNNQRIRKTVKKQLSNQAAPTKVSTRSRTTAPTPMRGEDR